MCTLLYVCYFYGLFVLMLKILVEGNSNKEKKG
jgi:hypothetical protein